MHTSKHEFRKGRQWSDLWKRNVEFIYGTIIDPIWPVERLGEQKPIPPEVYEARKVMVYNKAGKRLFEEVSLSSDGYYGVELRPGTYTIDINRIGIDSSSDVPKQIVIESGQVVVLNIDIDTGIR